MQVQVDPNELRYTAGLFSSGANELRQKAKQLEDILNGLVQGKRGWSGEASQAYSLKMEKVQTELQQKAGVLDQAVQILNQFALQMDNVTELRNQANKLEMALWNITDTSETAFFERQSLSMQISQFRQEADWQAISADAQATSALNSLSIPFPDFNIGISNSYGSLTDELDSLPTEYQSYYRRHKDLFVDPNTSTNEKTSLTFWDDFESIMAGGVDGTKEFVFGLFSTISHPVQSLQEIRLEVTHPQIILDYLKSTGNEIKSDWNKRNWYGFSKIITQMVWAVLLSKNVGLSEGNAEKATQIAQTGMEALKNLNKPTAQVVLSDGTVIRVSQDVLKSNQELGEYLEQASIRNGHLAGSEHPKTQIPFDSNGFPMFDSMFDAKLDPSQYTSSDPVQFKVATKKLYEEIQKNPKLGEQFTEQQLEQISQGITPKGYTWHHSQTEGVLQLVDKETHKLTGHTGGRSIWGGGASQR